MVVWWYGGMVVCWYGDMVIWWYVNGGDGCSGVCSGDGDLDSAWLVIQWMMVIDVVVCVVVVVTLIVCGYEDFFKNILFECFPHRRFLKVMILIVLENSGFFLIRWSVSLVKQTVLTPGSAPGSRYWIFKPPSSRWKAFSYFSYNHIITLIPILF